MSYFARLFVLIVELCIAEQEHILLPFAIHFRNSPRRKRKYPINSRLHTNW
jgi:hypothetical protein